MVTRTVSIRVIGDSSSATNALRQVGNQASGSMTQTGKAFHGVSNVLNSFGVFGPFGAAIGGLGSMFKKAAAEGETSMAKMKRVGTNVATGFAVAIGAIAIVSIKAAADYEQKINLLSTAAGESTHNLKAVGDGLLKISSDTGTSSTAMANAMYMVEKAGYDLAHGGLDVAKAAAQGAAEENANLTDVTKALTSVMATYHIPGSQAVTVMNQMVEASRHGKITMEEFSGALSTVVPIAKTSGLSFAQVAAAMATMTLHGTSAEKASQELAFAIRNLQAPNNVAIHEMQQLGINSNEVSQKLGKRGLTGTIEYLTQTVIAHMKGGNVLVGSFNASKAAAKDANIMIANMPPTLAKLAKEWQAGTITTSEWRKGIKDLPANMRPLASQFTALEGKAMGFSAQLRSGTPAAQTFNAAMKQIMGGSVGLNAALMLGGDNMSTFAKTADEVAAAGKKGGKDIQNWDKIQGTFNQQLKETKESAHNVAIQIGQYLLPAAKWVLGIFKDIFQWLSDHKEAAQVFGFLAVAVLVVVVAIKAWTMAQAALNAVMALNPVVMIIIAIVALIAGLIWAYNNVKWFRDAVNAAWKWIQEAAKNVADWFMTYVWPTLKEMGRLTADGFTQLWHAIEAVAKWIVGAWNWVVHAIAVAILWVIGAFNNFIHFIGGMQTNIRNFINSVVNFFTVTLPNGIRNGVSAISNWLYNAGRNLIVGLWNGIVSMWNWLTSSIGNIFNGLISWLKGLLGIHSPSAITHDIGLNFGKGLANGILASVGHVKSAAKAMVAATNVDPAALGGSQAGLGSVGGPGTVVTIPWTIDGVTLATALLKVQRTTGGMISVKPL